MEIYQVHAPISGILLTCYKEEGEEMKEGEIIFQRLTQGFDQSLLIVTHDLDFAKRTDRIIKMADGNLLR